MIIKKKEEEKIFEISIYVFLLTNSYLLAKFVLKLTFFLLLLLLFFYFLVIVVVTKIYHLGAMIINIHKQFQQ